MAGTGPLEKYPEHSKHSGGMTEEKYIGGMMASAVMQEVLDHLKKEVGKDLLKSLGALNAEDNKYDYPEARRHC